MAAIILMDEKPLVCGMCGRRICDIALFNGDVHLLRVPRRAGIPGKVLPEGRAFRITGARDPNVRVFAEESGDRFRIVHHHKRNGRGPLDRTITAATLEKLYNAAVAADDREVVLS